MSSPSHDDMAAVMCRIAADLKPLGALGALEVLVAITAAVIGEISSDQAELERTARTVSDALYELAIENWGDR